MSPKLPCIVPLRDIFLTDIIGYDRLKLQLKIYTIENEILGMPLVLGQLLWNKMTFD